MFVARQHCLASFGQRRKRPAGGRPRAGREVRGTLGGHCDVFAVDFAFEKQSWLVVCVGERVWSRNEKLFACEVGGVACKQHGSGSGWV